MALDVPAEASGIIFLNKKIERPNIKNNAKNLYICFKGIEGESLMTLLDINGYQVSTGSACTSGDLTPSSTLLAIEINKEDINSCIRITLSGKEEITELNKFCEVLKRCVETLRQLNK